MTKITSAKWNINKGKVTYFEIKVQYTFSLLVIFPDIQILVSNFITPTHNKLSRVHCTFVKTIITMNLVQMSADKFRQENVSL